jgi:hypothetical protein
VLASRHDSYAGGMLRRLQVCIDAFLLQTERFALASELIIVDWNPPADRALADALVWPADIPTYCTIRVITVRPDVHATFPFSDQLPMLIHRARNVGIRRAAGEFVLPTSPDILFSDELIERLSRGDLDPAAMYRIARHDVPEAALDVPEHDDRLRYCRDNVLLVHDQRGSLRRPYLPEMFTNAAGDFTLLSREQYWALRGVPEEREYHSAHFDTVFCFMAHAAGLREVVFTDPCRIYHVDHGEPSWRPRTSLVERTARLLPLPPKPSKRLVKWAHRRFPPRSRTDRSGVPYIKAGGPGVYERLLKEVVAARGSFLYNEEDWGIGGRPLPERVISSAAPLNPLAAAPR